MLFLVSSRWSSMAAAASASRRLRDSHSKDFYRDRGGNFSTAAVHKTKIRRKNIFSGEYFDPLKLKPASINRTGTVFKILKMN